MNFYQFFDFFSQLRKKLVSRGSRRGDKELVSEGDETEKCRGFWSTETRPMPFDNLIGFVEMKTHWARILMIFHELGGWLYKNSIFVSIIISRKDHPKNLKMNLEKPDTVTAVEKFGYKYPVNKLCRQCLDRNKLHIGSRQYPSKFAIAPSAT